MRQQADVNWIVHLCSCQAWQLAMQTGDYRPQSLEDEGFIHCSHPDQILQVANQFYYGLSDLVLLWIDPQQLIASVRWEPVGEQIFPHIYGPLNLTAVRAVSDFIPDEDGTFRRQPGL
jgi:uncharacterized protein (DUF952 family)